MCLTTFPSTTPTMTSQNPSFHDRADLSDLEIDIDPQAGEAGCSSETLVPVPDTGIKQVKIMGRETRSLKRAQERGAEEEVLPRGKKSRVYGGDDIKQVLVQQSKHGEILQDILKELRNLSSCVDSLKTTVTHKMTTMETKLSVQQDRIMSLQTARRDGFMNTLTLDTTQTVPLSNTPHWVNQPSQPARQQSMGMPPKSPAASFLDALGF